jgi:hypothetical protein
MSNLIDKLPGPLANLAHWVSDGRSASKISRLIAYTFVLATVCVVVIEGSNIVESRLIKAVTVDAAPSVELFHGIAAQFARMGEDFLVERNGKPGENFDQTKDFDIANKLLRQARIDATRNITYAPGTEHWDPSIQPKDLPPALAAIVREKGELGVIERMEEQRDQLMEVVTRARVMHERHDAAALADARKAYKLIVGELIEDAKAGAAVNLAYLEHFYAQRASVYKEVFWTDIGVGAFFAFIMALVWYRVVYGRFHRVFNIYLAAAVLLGGYGIFNAVTSFKAANAYLESYKKNSFDSILPLSDMQSAIYQARAIQALVLIDNANGAEEMKMLDEVIARIGKLGPNANFEDAISATSKGYSRNGCSPTKLQNIEQWPVTEGIMTGGLAKELNNLTWCGEYEAATNTVRAYAQFTTVWTQVQQLIAQGQRDRAIKLFSGNAPGEGGYLLKQLVDENATIGTLGTAIKVNKDAGEQDKNAAMGAIAHIKWGAPALAFAMWLLVIIGVVRQRGDANPARIARKRAAYTS